MKKKYILTLSLLVLAGFSSGAQNYAPTVQLRSIEVTGTGEKEIIPNELYVQITLQEYLQTPRDIKTRLNIQTLELKLQQAVKKAGLDPKNITVSDISQFKDDDTKHTPITDFLIRKQYLIKMPTIDKAEKIISMLDPKSVANTYVQRSTHTEIKTYQKALQIEAFNDAKERALNIAQAAGLRLGKVIKVQASMRDVSFSPYPLVMMRGLAAVESAEQNISFKNLKIRTEVNVVFELL